MRHLLLFVFGTVGLIVVASTVDAKCTWSGPGYRPEQNEITNSQMTCDMKGFAHGVNRPGDGYVMTSVTVSKKAHNGVVKAWGANLFQYKPASPGTDEFSLKQCATLNNTQSGCATLNYSVTIN
jgi:hypothetical protein